MKIFLLLLLIFGVISPISAFAQDMTGAAQVEEGELSATDLPAKLIKRIKSSPEDVVADATRMIVGYGSAKGLSASDIDRFIAIERASVRASAMRRLLAADLDNDGGVSPDEGAALLAVLSAKSRGDFALALTHADADGDGRVSAAEIRAQAQDVALADLSDDRAQALRAYIGFDADGNGLIVVDEVARRVAALAAGP